MSVTINADSTNGLVLTSDTSGEIKLQSAGTDTVTVKSDGKVGIGTSSPANPLDINLSLNEKVKISDGTQSIELIVKDGQLDIGTPEAKALVFNTNNTERARLTDGGLFRVTNNCQFGGTSVASTGVVVSNPDFNSEIGIKHANGVSSGLYYLYLVYNNSTIGGITQNGTTGVSYNTSSDYRLKENNVNITDGMDRVKLLKPYRFNFIADSDTTVDGFFAHEVQDVVPEAIHGTKDAVDDEGNPVYQGIDQSKLVPLLTAALQEAITKIEDLETRIQALENA